MAGGEGRFAPRACGLEVVDEPRQVKVRRKLQQNVDVVGFTVELDQLAAPILAALTGDITQAGQDWLRDPPATIFCR